MKKYVQCPRCELNYITTPGDKYCKVCMREMKGEGGQDDVEMCSVCNENPALPGRDICLFCLKEMSGGNTNRDENEPEEAVEASSLVSMPVGVAAAVMAVAALALAAKLLRRRAA